MAVDRGSLISLQLHELLDEEDGLGTVPAKAVFFLNDVAGNLLPHAVDFLIPEIFFIEIHLAQIMKERGNDNAFLGQVQSICGDRLFRHEIDVQGMLAQSAFICAVEACTGRRGEKIGPQQPVQKVLQSLAVDIFPA